MNQLKFNQLEFNEVPLRGIAPFGRKYTSLVGAVMERKTNVMHSIHLINDRFNWGQDSNDELAINCCNLLMPILNDGTDVEINKQLISLNTFNLYKKFKEEFLINLDKNKSFCVKYERIHEWVLLNTSNWLTELAAESKNRGGLAVFSGISNNDLILL